MRQRTINWAGAMRDMRKSRASIWPEMTPEQRRAWAEDQARKAIEKADKHRVALARSVKADEA